MPSQCVLNGLEIDPVPPELEALDPLSKQMIQWAKPFQAVYRLGTYTGKVPSHTSVKACKGTMFFLPLPLVEEIDKVATGKCQPTQLPDPELYIIVNSKKKTIWQSLVNLDLQSESLKPSTGSMRRQPRRHVSSGGDSE